MFIIRDKRLCDFFFYNERRLHAVFYNISHTDTKIISEKNGKTADRISHIWNKIEFAPSIATLVVFIHKSLTFFSLWNNKVALFIMATKSVIYKQYLVTHLRHVYLLLHILVNPKQTIQG